MPFRPDAGGWRRFPALVAAVTADGGDVCGVHRTWLDPRRPAKARVPRPRKALGRVHGLAVRFGDPGSASTLLVGEGIETVLSLVTVLPDGYHAGTLAAAALSAGSLGAFVPPANVTRLLVAQDRDEQGERAALRLQLRCTRLGVATAVLVPAGNDFNEDLKSFGTEPLAHRLAPLLARPRGQSRCGSAAGEEREERGAKLRFFFFRHDSSSVPPRARASTPASQGFSTALRSASG